MECQGAHTTKDWCRALAMMKAWGSRGHLFQYLFLQEMVPHISWCGQNTQKITSCLSQSCVLSSGLASNLLAISVVIKAQYKPQTAGHFENNIFALGLKLSLSFCSLALWVRGTRHGGSVD